MDQKIEDSFRHVGLRRKLLFELRSKGVTNEDVLSAIEQVPRHLFIDNAFVEFAYADMAFPILSGQTISHPSTVAAQSTLLEVKQGMKVLEIGTGSGYQASVLYKMGVKVYSVERHRELYLHTKKLLERLGYGIKIFFGDGFQGLPQFALYDRILVTCGTAKVPMKLFEQLKPGGLMVIPLGDNEDNYTMTKVTKGHDLGMQLVAHGAFRFVPMLQQKVK